MSNQETRIIRRREVRDLTGLSDSSIDRAVRAGMFPAPIKLLPDPRCRSVGWPESAVRAWIAERIEAAQSAKAAA